MREEFGFGPCTIVLHPQRSAGLGANRASARAATADRDDLGARRAAERSEIPTASTGEPSPQGDQTEQVASTSGQSTSQADIFSKNVITVLLDGRLALANGERSWVNRGLGKTAFQGTSDGNYQPYAVAQEADIIWTPRFTSSLSASVSAAYQRHQEHAVDLLEAFVSFLPEQKGPVGFQMRAGIMWPEISLEHTTGGAWSTVNTLTPSAINAWVGEEVKVLGLEGTVRTSIGDNVLAFTGSVFGFDDTSGTLLSFRGWALHNEKATVFGHFPLPPLNPFITVLQQHKTRSLIEIDIGPVSTAGSNGARRRHSAWRCSITTTAAIPRHSSRPGNGDGGRDSGTSASMPISAQRPGSSLRP